LAGKSEGRYQLEELVVDRRMILEMVLLRTGTSYGLLWTW